MRLIADTACFVCGAENEAGLHVDFECGPGFSSATFTPQAAHQGYAGFTHGGIVSAILDEAMVYAAVPLGWWVATAEMTVRFKKPAVVGAPLSVSARVLREAPRLVECEAEVRDAAGEVVARATGKLLKQARVQEGDTRSGRTGG